MERSLERQGPERAAVPSEVRRVLVAGVGNVLRGDDGFGPAVLRSLLARAPELPGVRIVEVGISGIRLVHELMDGYEALILIDAVDRAGTPGTLYVLEPQLPLEECPAPPPDLHHVVPSSVLSVARALGVLPEFVRIVGCQPGSVEEFVMELTPPVARAVPAALDAVRELLATFADPRQEAKRR
jgi:hydrogenase maturation protease